MNLIYRLLAILPPGRIHEGNVRRQLGMPTRHPERCTRPGTGREQRLLAELQESAWPDGDWADAIRYRDGA